MYIKGSSDIVTGSNHVPSVWAKHTPFSLSWHYWERERVDFLLSFRSASVCYFTWILRNRFLRKSTDYSLNDPSLCEIWWGRVRRPSVGCNCLSFLLFSAWRLARPAWYSVLRASTPNPHHTSVSWTIFRGNAHEFSPQIIIFMMAITCHN